MVSERRNFQRVYDLAERVLPGGVDLNEPTPDELGRFNVGRFLKAQGVASVSEIRWRRGSKESVQRVVGDLVDSGELVECTVEGFDGEPHYASVQALEQNSQRRRRRREVHLLSPFNNAVILRHRVKRLFDFDYTLECYHPEAKRRHGYFCLPILWGDRFIGRMDPKADRSTGTLIVKRMAFERGFKDFDRALPALGVKLRSFARFNGCREIRIDTVSPRKVLSAVRRATEG